MRQEGLAARAIVIAMSEVRSGWSGITRRDGGYRDRYLNRWVWTAGLTLGALLALDVLLVVLADGVLPTILVLVFPVIGSAVNLAVALPRSLRT